MTTEHHDHARVFPRCVHEFPDDDLTYRSVTAEQLQECREDAAKVDARHDPADAKMGLQVPKARLKGFVCEQVVANVCGIPRDRSLRASEPDFPTGIDVKGKTEDEPIELTVNRGVHWKMLRFIMVQCSTASLEPDATEGRGWIWCSASRIYLQTHGRDIRRGRHRDNPKAINWTLDAFWQSKLQAETEGGICLICRVDRGFVRHPIWSGRLARPAPESYRLAARRAQLRREEQP